MMNPNLTDGRKRSTSPTVSVERIGWLDSVTLVLPRFMAGFTFVDWMRVLHHNEWRVDPIFVPRAAAATAGTVVTSLLKPFDDACCLDPADDPAWRRPIFILGCARSGTTHLFNLLARDERFAHATQLDVFHPHTFLTLRRLGLHRLLRFQPSRRRAMDNVRVGWLSPAEDSIALAVLAASGDPQQAVFRRTAPLGAMPSNVFRSALAAFTRKLVHAHHRSLLLKSPGHMERIPDILAVFPDARFVTIFRDPRSTLASVLSFFRSPGVLWSALQWPPPRGVDDLIGEMGVSMDRYFEARDLIPPANLVEVRHEDLVADESGTLGAIYTWLGIAPPSSALRAAARGESSRPYSRNVHPPLDDAVRAKLETACRRLFDAGWYVA